MALCRIFSFILSPSRPRIRKSGSVSNRGLWPVKDIPSTTHRTIEIFVWFLEFGFHCRTVQVPSPSLQIQCHQKSVQSSFLHSLGSSPTQTRTNPALLFQPLCPTPLAPPIALSKWAFKVLSLQPLLRVPFVPSVYSLALSRILAIVCFLRDLVDLFQWSALQSPSLCLLFLLLLLLLLCVLSNCYCSRERIVSRNVDWMCLCERSFVTICDRCRFLPTTLLLSGLDILLMGRRTAKAR